MHFTPAHPEGKEEREDLTPECMCSRGGLGHPRKLAESATALARAGHKHRPAASLKLASYPPSIAATSYLASKKAGIGID